MIEKSWLEEWEKSEKRIDRYMKILRVCIVIMIVSNLVTVACLVIEYFAR